LICWLVCPTILKSLGARRIDRRNAKDCNGASLSVGHKHLNLHPAEETRAGFAPIPEAGFGRMQRA
jgi:hypothetical protein